MPGDDEKLTSTVLHQSTNVFHRKRAHADYNSLLLLRLGIVELVVKSIANLSPEVFFARKSFPVGTSQCTRKKCYARRAKVVCLMTVKHVMCTICEVLNPVKHTANMNRLDCIPLLTLRSTPSFVQDVKILNLRAHDHVRPHVVLC